MPSHSLAHPSRLALARLTAALLALAVVLPGQPLLAAPVPAARPARAQPALLPLGPADPAVNVAPVANNDSLAAFTNEDFQELYVLDNDTDIDGDTLIIDHVNSTPNGDAVGGGLTGPFDSIAYKPNAGFSGNDTFDYTISDRHGHTDTATVTVHVGASGTASNRFAVYAGSNDSSFWTISPYGGATGPTAAGACDNSSGLSVEEALLQNPFEHLNAFDNGLTLWVNNSQVKPVLPMAVTRHSLVSGPKTMPNGIKVTMHYDGLLDSNTLRTRAVLANTSGVTKVFTVTVATNVGSDATTVIPGSSDGNTSINTGDRWVVTSDSLTNPSEIVDTHVLFGPPASPPILAPSLVANTTFSCAQYSAGDTHGVRADFHLTLNNGETKQLLFFNQLHSSNTVALADAAVFNTEPVGMLQGLTNTDLNQIVNWKLLPVTYRFLPLLWR